MGIALSTRARVIAGPSSSAAIAIQAALAFPTELPMVILCSSLFLQNRFAAQACWPPAVVARASPLGNTADKKSSNNQRKNPAHRREPPRFEPHLPPTVWFLRQARRNFLPDLPPVVCSRVRHRQRIQRREHRFDSFQLAAAPFAGRQMLCYYGTLLRNSLAISDQLFFLHMFHDSVPIARACAFVSTNGCSV